LQECPQPEIEVGLNLCIDVFKAIEKYFQIEDQNCIVLLGKFNNATRGRTLCNRTVGKLKLASRETDVDATINSRFCKGLVMGFSAKLNGAGLRWVSNS